MSSSVDYRGLRRVGEISDRGRTDRKTLTVLKLLFTALIIEIIFCGFKQVGTMQGSLQMEQSKW